MGTISSSTGLISGMDIGSIVKQLMEIESRPLEQLKTRITEVQAQQSAYQEISGLMSSILTPIMSLSLSTAFTARTSGSSNESALTASADSSAALGTYSFLVKSVVSTHQMASAGFADTDSTPVGAGSLVLENAASRVDDDTELSELNGGSGVRRGQIRITDRTGTSATVDLRAAHTMGDVLDAINSQSAISVRAYVSGDRLVVEDQTGLNSGTLSVSSVGGSYTAADLGVLGSESGNGKITSATDLVRLTGNTLLSSLNDGLGVRSGSGSDFRITLANGRQFDIDMSSTPSMNTSLAEVNGGQGVGAGTLRITNSAGVSKELQLTGTETLKEINAKLNSSAYADLNVKIASVSSSGNLVLADSSDGSGQFKVEDVSGSIAGQLKLTGEATDGSITGRLNYQFTTITSLVRKFEYARDAAGITNSGDFTVSISADGKGLVFNDNTTGGAATSLSALNDSHTLEDLGLSGSASSGTLNGDRIVSGLNTVLLENLNGGSGVRLGTAQFTLRDGSTRTVDFSGIETLQDVINKINEQEDLHAEVSSGGTGLLITDNSSGTGTLTASGVTLDDLHVSGSSASGNLEGGNVHRRYVAESTLLSSLNGGQGIGLTDGSSSSTASFIVTNSSGVSTTVTLAGNRQHTVGDALDQINNTLKDTGVQARIGSNGDGIEFYETGATGSGKLSVSEVGTGTTAAKLHIKGTAGASTPGVLTGSFATTIEIGAADTLEDVVKKINNAGASVRASIIDDGSGSRPYRMVLTSTTSGKIGEMGVNASGSGLSFTTLSEAQDARVLVGNLDSPNSILINSSTNKVTGVAQGVTLNLTAASDTPIQVTVGQDVDSAVTQLQTFVDGYNALLDRLDELTKYDADTEEKGILLGDSTVLQLRSRLQAQMSRSLSSNSVYKTLMSVGMTTLDDSSTPTPLGGGRLRLDEDAFREAMSENPDEVKALFTKVSVKTNAAGVETVSYDGIAASLKQEIRALAGDSTGLLANADAQLADRLDLYNTRIDDMQTLLDKKEDRYYAQFQAMEQALASLQTQQSSLSSLSSLASSMSS